MDIESYTHPLGAVNEIHVAHRYIGLSMHRTVDDIAAELFRKLDRTENIIVFAESCTAGLISGTLGRVPGVSKCLAGSAVVYQLATKSAWLEVAADVLRDPGPVSQVVSEQMAVGVMNNTPHATMAASVTGHLGPGAPAEQDGTAWSSIAFRAEHGIIVRSVLLRLDDNSSVPANDDFSIRRVRQESAVRQVLEFCIEALSEKC